MTNNQKYYLDNKDKIKEKTKINCGGQGEFYQLVNKKEIREAAHYTCQRCGKVVKGHALHIHHIIPSEILKERNDEKDNLVCICNSCHQSLHALIKDKEPEEIIEITKKYMNGEILSIKEKREQHEVYSKLTKTVVKTTEDKIKYLNQRWHTLVKAMNSYLELYRKSTGDNRKTMKLKVLEIDDEIKDTKEKKKELEKIVYDIKAEWHEKCGNK